MIMLSLQRLVVVARLHTAGRTEETTGQFGLEQLPHSHKNTDQPPKKKLGSWSGNPLFVFCM